MLFEIDTYLNDNFSPEQQNLYRRVFKVLDEFEVENVEDIFMDLIMQYDSEDPIKLIDKFYLECISMVKITCEMQGIKLSDEADLEYSLIVLECLYNIQDYMDVETIVRIIETNYDDKEKIMELFLLVGNFQENKMLESIEEVNRNIFHLILTHFKEKIDNLSTESEKYLVSQNLLNNLRMFTGFLQYPNCIAESYILNGMKIGTSFKLYYEQIKKDYVNLSLEQLASELAFLFMISKDSFESPLMFWKNNADYLVGNTENIIKMNGLLLEIFNGFDRYKQNEPAVK